MKQRYGTVLLAVALLAGLCQASEDDNDDKTLTAAEKVSVAKAVSTSIVHVEYTVQYDKGEAPRGGSWSSFEEFVREDRPKEEAGLLLADNKVLTTDLMIHPRFVKQIVVRFGHSVVDAKLAAFAVDRNAVILKLARPLAGAKPAVFDPKREGPYYSLAHMLRENEWLSNVRSVGTSVTVTQAGRKYHPASGCWLIVDKEGLPVGVCTDGRLDIEGKWKGSPLDWPALTAKQMDQLVAQTQRRADAAVFRVALSFRSPKKSAAGGAMSGRSSSGNEGKAEQNVVGMLIDDKTVVVLAYLRPKVTARLERIVVHAGRAGPVEAKFSHTLADYGCFLATLDKPVKGGLTLSDKSVTLLRNRLLMSAQVTIQGENRVTYFDHRRIRGYDLGWKRHVYPQIGGRNRSLFLFDADGELAVFPLARRLKVSAVDRWSQGEVLATPAARLGTVLGDLANNVDNSNVPLVAEEESRLAWLGVELQRLNRDLARLNNLSDLTRDGQIGALVSYIYPGSPAAKAGVTAGPDDDPWFLISIHVEGDPKPIDVSVDREQALRADFPWRMWDSLPPRYWDGKFPTPWQPVEMKLNRTLTDVGFGKKFTATFFTKGKQVKKSFTVVPSPTHYESAASFKAESIGLTVRQMTYEVRRYFLKGPGDPGVIVSTIEPGSRAGVGGIRPFEIITHVNDRPVAGVKEFEKLLAGQTQLRLTVVRVTTGRLVKLRMDGP